MSERGSSSFDFKRHFKSEIFKLLQSSNLQKMVTNFGSLVLVKNRTGSQMQFPMITSILDMVPSTDFKDFVRFFQEMFKVHDPQQTMKVPLEVFARMIESKFQLRMDDPIHFPVFFKDFVQEDKFFYSGYVNKVLSVLFPALEDNIE